MSREKRKLKKELKLKKKFEKKVERKVAGAILLAGFAAAAVSELSLKFGAKSDK